MTDYFALLGEPRRPFVDPERVKETFHRVSQERHPDRGGENFADLNVAQETLRNPAARLRHLLDLEFPSAASNRVQPAADEIAGEFASTHETLRALEACVARKHAASGALSRALLSQEEARIKGAAHDCLNRLQGLLGDAESDLRKLSDQWNPQAPDAATKLLNLYQRFAYLARWMEQLREQLFQLEV